jgi:hypothetical protein
MLPFTLAASLLAFQTVTSSPVAADLDKRQTQYPVVGLGEQYIDPGTIVTGGAGNT